MIAAVTDNAGNVVALHRTYLARDGQKAEIEPVKATLALLLGGAIRTQPIEPGKPLVIGEGIESSASAGRLLGAPAWSVVSSANLRHSLILPPEAKRIIVAADPDDPGERAAIAAALRWRPEGREVRIARPDSGKGDFNDLLLGSKNNGR
jgi:putative DNA primase/helicase